MKPHFYILSMLILTGPSYGNVPTCGMEEPIIYEEQTFEGLAPGWSIGNLSNTPLTWGTTTQESHTGDFSAHSEGVDYVADNVLISPIIQIPETEQKLTLHFWHKYSFMVSDDQNGEDGAILEVSINGNDFIQVPNPFFEANPYDGTMIIGNSENPLKGLDVWFESQSAWTESIVDISSFIGQGNSVQFRFRLGTNQIDESTGWYIDDFSIQGCLEDVLFTNGFDT